MKKSVVLFLMVMLLLTGSKVNNLKRHNNFRVQSNYAYAVEPDYIKPWHTALCGDLLLPVLHGN